MKISWEIEKKLTGQWFAFLQEKIVEEFLMNQILIKLFKTVAILKIL